MDPVKVQAIHDWIQPTSVKSLQKFLGFANFYHRFIANFSSAVKPLTDLTKKGADVTNWSSAAVSAFQELKRRFTSAPVLRQPDVSLPFQVEVDASEIGAGAILSQRNFDGSLMKPCAFFSRKFSPAERNYDVGNRELLAMKWAFEEWRHWLEGAKHRIVVLTDHKNLIYLESAKRLNPRQARWSLFFSRFDFVVSYLPGTKNVKADALSRSFLPDSPGVLEPVGILKEGVILSAISPDLRRVLWEFQADKPDRCLVGKLFVPDRWTSKVISEVRCSVLAGHPGIFGIRDLVGQVEPSVCPGVDSVVDRLQQIWAHVVDNLVLSQEKAQRFANRRRSCTGVFLCPVECRAKYCSVQATGKVREPRRLRTAVLYAALNRANQYACAGAATEARRMTTSYEDGRRQTCDAHRTRTGTAPGNCREESTVAGSDGIVTVSHLRLEDTGLPLDAGEPGANDQAKKEIEDDRLCNGEIFFVVNDVEKDNIRELTLSDEDRTYTLNYKLLRSRSGLRHAWARTIHTFQGSEEDTVIYVLGNTGWQNWKHVYTAVTRGRKRVYIIARKTQLDKAIASKARDRKTSLKQRLKEKLPQRKTFGQPAATSSAQPESSQATEAQEAEVILTPYPVPYTQLKSPPRFSYPPVPTTPIAGSCTLGEGERPEHAGHIMRTPPDRIQGCELEESPPQKRTAGPMDDSETPKKIRAKNNRTNWAEESPNSQRFQQLSLQSPCHKKLFNP
ncbi:unnamed protein product [Ranitomeya imitator]|uniref:Uncharacterized protein n=1 Tax=Ranitomeya imitator TaxID=111125 RepID=A0ABN9MHW2_9NEOB|nr:unnamed protein product [Ranitomeya imitator]